MTYSSIADPTVFENALYANLPFLRRSLRAVRDAFPTLSPDEGFAPPFRLPTDSPALRAFFEPSTVTVRDLGTHAGASLRLLDLMGNPRTRTTKTFASLVLVGRAVAHVHETGEPVTIVTPSSGNKATALRDAVLRAIESGLVSPSELSISVIVPAQSRDKLWASPLSNDAELRDRNPVSVLASSATSVKHVARAFADKACESFFGRTGRRLWYTLRLIHAVR